LGEKHIVGTHTRPDLDAIVSIWLWQNYGDERAKKSVVALFLTDGDKALITPQLMGVTLFDRGKGEFDHHQNNQIAETTASIVARKLGVAENPEIKRLLRKVQRSDLQGESLPFDASDLIKCMQRLEEITDQEIIELGTRIIKDGVEFSKKKLKRNNLSLQQIIREFLASKEIIPPKFQDYLEKLNNPGFERPFDLAEILAVEGESAKDFLLKLLEYEYRDSLNYLRAIEEVRKAWKVTVRGVNIVADVSDNPRFKDAARNDQKALITIQRRSNGQTGIYFDTERIDDALIETLISMIRLEECLIQHRPIPKADLRKPEWIEGIPEWYYYKAPRIPGKKKKPGRFLLNGSLTAPDVPPSKIPMETLRELAQKAIIYQPFNWVRWATERIALYMKKET
jgi:hypothetical protein